jgi:hypothetical protein
METILLVKDAAWDNFNQEASDPPIAAVGPYHDKAGPVISVGRHVIGIGFTIIPIKFY